MSALLRASSNIQIRRGGNSEYQTPVITKLATGLRKAVQKLFQALEKRGRAAIEYVSDFCHLSCKHVTTQPGRIGNDRCVANRSARIDPLAKVSNATYK